MASVEKIEKVVTTVDYYSLTLSVPEVETLLVVLARIAGSTSGSARMHTQAIYDALMDNGAPHYREVKAFQHVTGSINFSEWHEPVTQWM